MAEKKTCLGNCDYNIVHQLHNKLKFLWAVDQYIEDAKKQGCDQCVKIWQRIKEDELKHAELLKKHLKEDVQAGEF